MKRNVERLAAVMFALSILLAATPPQEAVARQQPQLGPHIGFIFDGEDLLLGGQFAIPLIEQVEFYPSADVYLPDDGTLLGFNADLRYMIPTQEGFSVYAGGGLNLLYRSIAGVSDTDLGVNLIGGAKTEMGTIHPFAEGRAIIHGESSFQLVVGLNFVIATTNP